MFRLFFIILICFLFQGPLYSLEKPHVNKDDAVLEWTFSVSFPHDLEGNMETGFKINGAENPVKLSEETYLSYTSKTFLIEKPVPGYFGIECIKFSGAHVPDGWLSGEHDACPQVDIGVPPDGKETGEIPVIIRMEMIYGSASSWWPGPQSGTFKITFIPNDEDAFFTALKEQEQKGALARTLAATLAVTAAGGLISASWAAQLLRQQKSTGNVQTKTGSTTRVNKQYEVQQEKSRRYREAYRRQMAQDKAELARDKLRLEKIRRMKREFKMEMNYLNSGKDIADSNLKFSERNYTFVKGVQDYSALAVSVLNFGVGKAIHIAAGTAFGQGVAGGIGDAYATGKGIFDMVRKVGEGTVKGVVGGALSYAFDKVGNLTKHLTIGELKYLGKTFTQAVTYTVKNPIKFILNTGEQYAKGKFSNFAGDVYVDDIKRKLSVFKHISSLF